VKNLNTQMTNLQYVNTIRSDKLPVKNPWLTPDEHLRQRNEWLTRQIRKYYSQEETDAVLTNRRSDFSDNALIDDFMRAEQPEHPIPMDSCFDKAIRAVTEQFRPNRILHPVHFTDLRYYPLSLNVSAEAPFTEKDFKFVPMDRNVDEESSKPKTSKPGDATKLRKWKNPVRVEDYLRWKHSIGLIDDSSRTYHNLLSEIFIYNRPLIHKIKYMQEPFWTGSIPRPYKWNTLHARSHVVGKDEPDKIRAVFGATKLLLQAELMFIWPLQATYLNTDRGRLLWGREMSKGGWRKLLNEIHRKGKKSTLLGIDWSQFDKRLLHQLIRIVHRIWRSYYDFSQYEKTSKYKGKPKSDRHVENLWNWMCNAITDTPILLPNGQLWRWNWNGFGSGYQQTQLMDSFANAIMIYTCLCSLGVNVESKRFWARFQGDDSLLAFCEQMFRIYGNNFLDMLEESAKHYFNAKLNVKKSEINDRVTGMTVLSYQNQCGLAYRTDEDLLRHLFFPERPQNYGTLAASAAGLAQASLGCSTRFYDLCKLIWTKLVIEREVKPKWKALRWLQRTGQEEVFEQLKNSEFPTLECLRYQRFSMTKRLEKENQRQWPTATSEEFYFLDPV